MPVMGQKAQMGVGPWGKITRTEPPVARTVQACVRLWCRSGQCRCSLAGVLLEVEMFRSRATVGGMGFIVVHVVGAFGMDL